MTTTSGMLEEEQIHNFIPILILSWETRFTYFPETRFYTERDARSSCSSCLWGWGDSTNVPCRPSLVFRVTASSSSYSAVSKLSSVHAWEAWIMDGIVIVHRRTEGKLCLSVKQQQAVKLVTDGPGTGRECWTGSQAVSCHSLILHSSTPLTHQSGGSELLPTAG
jgi:hypothetical protein